MVATALSDPITNENSDSELILRTLAGDGQAYGEIVERYQRKIFRVASAIVRNDMEADLITQDVFVQAYQSLGKFEGKAGLGTWLTRIAINRSRDLLRGQRIRSFLSLSDPGEEHSIPEIRDERPDAERTAISAELMQAIDRAVARLSEQQRIIFTLRHYEDLSLEQIASHLGLKGGTVRTHLFRAIHKIRKELAAWVGYGSSPEETFS